MGTRSSIGYKLPTGEVRGIYCHWDGYVEHNGKILMESYTDAAKIKALIDLGDLSSLGAEIGNKIDFNATSEERKKQCVAFGRDRGEDDISAQMFDDINDYVTYYADSVAYMYVWNGNEWIITNGNSVFDRVEDLLQLEAA